MWHYKKAYQVKMRRLFNLYNDWLLQWGFPDCWAFIKNVKLFLVCFLVWLSKTFTRNILSFICFAEWVKLSFTSVVLLLREFPSLVSILSLTSMNDEHMSGKGSSVFFLKRKGFIILGESLLFYFWSVHMEQWCMVMTSRFAQNYMIFAT